MNIPDDHVHDFVSNVVDHSKIPYNEGVTTHISTKCIPKRIFTLRKNTIYDNMCCSEFVGSCLKELKVIDEKHVYRCIRLISPLVASKPLISSVAINVSL